MIENRTAEEILALARAAKMDRVTLLNALTIKDEAIRAKDALIDRLCKELAASTRELARLKEGRA